MKSALRQLSIMSSRPNSGWLTLLLLLAVLVPSVCLIWFMNQAMRNERMAVRQELMEAYRGSLALAAGRLEAWPAQISSGVVIRYDAEGRITDPAPAHPGEGNPKALAVQSRIRSLVKDGEKSEAVAAIRHAVGDGNFAGATDEQGRWILPNLELMALEITNAPDLLASLQGELNDSHRNMPSAQRRFLMHRLMELFPKQAVFPRLAGDDLTARYLETNPEPSREPKLKMTALPGIWQIASAGRRALMLLDTAAVQKQLRDAAALSALPPGVRLEVVPPGGKSGSYLWSAPAGINLPGWELVLTTRNGDLFAGAARDQIAAYIWIGALTMTTAIVLAVFGVGMIRRQAAVAQLRNDLLANVTHELKTPLSSMRLLVDTLLQSNPIPETTARQYLELIAAENTRLSRLIDNFLTFSRIERNKVVFTFTAVPANSIAETAAAAVRERFNVDGCKFSLQAASALPRIQADADAMVTVLLNLLDNAWKYSGEEKQILLSAGAENGHVIFSVKDNGIGLSPNESKRIFDRFYQVDQRLNRTGGGCGLGLSIVQFIVNAHHGAIRVESEANRGSTFIVSLPAAASESLS